MCGVVLFVNIGWMDGLVYVWFWNGNFFKRLVINEGLWSNVSYW